MLLDCSPDEEARIAAGRCACGCGAALPPIPVDAYGRPDDRGRRVASSACRKRLHRQRIKAGRNLTLAERSLRRRRVELEARIAAARREQRAAQSTATRMLLLAKQLEAALAALLSGPGLFEGNAEGDEGDADE